MGLAFVKNRNQSGGRVMATVTITITDHGDQTIVKMDASNKDTPEWTRANIIGAVAESLARTINTTISFARSEKFQDGAE